MCDKENTTHPPVIRFESQWSHGDVAGMMVTKWEIPKWAWCGLISAGVGGAREGRRPYFSYFPPGQWIVLVQPDWRDIFRCRFVFSGYVDSGPCTKKLDEIGCRKKIIAWISVEGVSWPVYSRALQSDFFGGRIGTHSISFYSWKREQCVYIYTYTLSEKKCECRSIWQPVLLTTSIYV